MRAAFMMLRLRTRDGQPAATTLFGYTGRPLDAETGLANNHHRWYDATTGRWISKDPIGFAAGDANLSRYAGNRPVNATDPSGLLVKGDNWTDDQKTVLDLAEGDAELIQSLKNLFRALDDLPTLTPLDWYNYGGYCHAWTNLVYGPNGAVMVKGNGDVDKIDDERFRGIDFIYLKPKYDGDMPFWKDHGVIEVRLNNGAVFWLDRFAYGGSDHIFLEWPATLRHPNQAKCPQPPRPPVYNPYDHNWPRSY